MPNIDSIHFDYHPDQSLVIHFLQQGLVLQQRVMTATEAQADLVDFLQQKVTVRTSLSVFINCDVVICLETQIPAAFSNEDIMQYIAVEQAKLFPMLEEAIYFDFLVLATERNVKKIMIAACNVSYLAQLVSWLDSVKIISWVYLGVSQYTALNLLPWRYLQKKTLQRKRWKIFGLITISIGLILLISSFAFIKLARRDETIAALFFSDVKQQVSTLETLENINKQYQVLLQLWDKQAKIAYHQAYLKNMLITVEQARPSDVVLDIITWSNNTLLLQGRAKNIVKIRSYFNHIQQQAMSGRISFLGSAGNLPFPFQFEIEVEDKMR